MDELLKLLRRNALESPQNLAKMLGVEEREVLARIEEYKRTGVIRGYQAILDEDRLNLNVVNAVIEVKVTPEREGGFDRVAARISKFPEVDSLHLMSGAFDLLLFVSGRDLKQVAGFVSEKLASIEGVVATTTHFMLKTYKKHGVLMEAPPEHERLTVSP